MTTVGIPYVPLQCRVRKPHLSDSANEMSLRDYFAGQVLSWPSNAEFSPEEAASAAYDYADAMIAERAKETGQ